jgi:hypothetical protein
MAAHAGLASSMRELNRRHRALRLQELGDAAERRDMRIGPKAHIAVGDAPLALHRGRLNEDETRAAQGEAAEMDEVPVIGEPVPRRVLTHRRNDKAIAQRQPTQRHRREKERLGHGAPVLKGKGRRSSIAAPSRVRRARSYA